jgi:hypothetical protein
VRSSRVVLFGTATMVGAVLGWTVARLETSRHAGSLFDRRPRRRYAALVALESRRGPETIQLLRDYLRWERQPLLRQRARGLLRRLESALA